MQLPILAFAFQPAPVMAAPILVNRCHHLPAAAAVCVQKYEQ